MIGEVNKVDSMRSICDGDMAYQNGGLRSDMLKKRIHEKDNAETHLRKEYIGIW